MMFLFGIFGGFLLQLITKLLPKKCKKITQRIALILLLVSFLFMIVGGIAFFVSDALHNLFIKLPFILSFGLIIGLSIGGACF